ncbi:hypothetical protein [Bradyrhizobium sp. CSS354]|uniref:hypothetical protein n=1 Tax=Bradyrhizobium sp. CSS354 TaxID=2699172 RepID=UPI0023B0A921|nr:hypothetical protein [Bradyrhizobium sp. CSS354]MDE5460201.1 hypothetical protein [Bradyrhizobium sp. CSS354]
MTIERPMFPPRRRFLLQAAGVAAGSAVLGMALPLPQPAVAAVASPDPIYAAIEAHKTAKAALEAALHLYSALDRELPLEKCRSRVTAWEETIVETDDPRWIESERALDRCHDAETDAACALLSEGPTTMAGCIALLKYAVEADTDGMSWPEGLYRDVNDPGPTRTGSWHQLLVENLAEIMPELALGVVA